MCDIQGRSSVAGVAGVAGVAAATGIVEATLGAAISHFIKGIDRSFELRGKIRLI